MDADRVRAYLQVACAGLGFDIGEVWWMSNESGTSTVAAIEENCGNESDSSADSHGHGAYADLVKIRSRKDRKRRTPKKRFLQLYTSKAYCNQRSKLVQPHDSDNEPGIISYDHSTAPGSPSKSNSKGSPTKSSASRQLIRRTDSAVSLELDQEHVLSPRIVEAVTHSTQVVWANCQKTEGLLGRSDIKLQTAIGMPVGVDESGNVWVVVMFSPKNVESSSDAIDYLQYISRSAASTSIPCLLPVVGDAPPVVSDNGTKMICDGPAASTAAEAEEAEKGDQAQAGGKEQPHHHHSLVSIKPNRKQPDHTQELGDGVTAKFVSFNINDDDEKKDGTGNSEDNSNGLIANGSGIAGGMAGGPSYLRSNSLTSDHDLRNAPKDDWGIPILPHASEMGGPSPTNGANNGGNGAQLDLVAIDSAITDAFDEASYGVWSTIMNSAGGGAIRTSESIATKMHLIQERLEELRPPSWE